MIRRKNFKLKVCKGGLITKVLVKSNNLLIFRKSAKHLDSKKVASLNCSAQSSRCISRTGSIIRLDLEKIKRM